MSKYAHEDKGAFISAVRATAGESGFSEALVEKDYFCSVILKEIYSSKGHGLIFKGGTLLNKVHAGFYRLSEDLDFSIDADPHLPRKKRSALFKPAKEHVNQIVRSLTFSFSEELVGKNEQSQYMGVIAYDSLILGGKGSIKIEVGLRERVLEQTELWAKTLAKDPFSGEWLVPEFSIIGLSLREAYAEKIRATFSRREPAIRDIFDLDYAYRSGILDVAALKGIVKHKFETQGQKSDLSESRKQLFFGQVQTELRPVLRMSDFAQFDFERAWKKMLEIQEFLKV